MPGGSRKGFPFEREVSKRLSLWYTEGERDDVIWRTQNSGGRATIRSRKGKRTEGQYGDLTYTDPIAKPLFDRCLIECKRGYKRWSALDLVDAGPTAAKQVLERWLEKAAVDMRACGAEYFMIIAKRDQRKPVVIIPQVLMSGIANWFGSPLNNGWMLKIKRYSQGRRGKVYRNYWLLSFEHFLDWVHPDYFKKGAA